MSRFGTIRVAVLAAVMVAGLCGSQPARAAPDEAEAGGRCPASAPAFDADPAAPHWNGWGVDVSQTRFQPAGMAGLSAQDVPRLKLKWAFAFADVMRVTAQPTVVGGRLFIGSHFGWVYSLDAASGCVAWKYRAGAPVRTAITIGSVAGRPVAYFGDAHGMAYALDAAIGSTLWVVRVEDHPAAMITGAPLLAGGALFVPVSSFEERSGADPHRSCCTFRGSVSALDPATGKLRWKTYTIADAPTPRALNSAGVRLHGPSGAAIWSSPTFDAAKNAVYVTTGDNYSDPPTDTSDAIMAFDAASGRRLWAHQVTAGDAFTVGCLPEPGPNCPKANGPDFDFGSSAILASLPGGRRVLVAGQKSGVVTAVDPDKDGEVLWQTRVGRGSPFGGVEWGSAADASDIYVAVSDTGLSVVQPGTPGSQPSPFNPALAFLLDPRRGGGLHALRFDTGAEVWQTPNPGCQDAPLGCGPAQSAAVTAIPGVVFSGGLDGHIRAYSAQDGRIVWDFDTKREYRTVNGVAGHGGSLDGAGAVVVGGTVYVDSGSGLWGGVPGNVLLAFTVDGR